MTNTGGSIAAADRPESVFGFARAPARAVGARKFDNGGGGVAYDTGRQQRRACSAARTSISRRVRKRIRHRLGGAGRVGELHGQRRRRQQHTVGLRVRVTVAGRCTSASARRATYGATSPSGTGGCGVNDRERSCDTCGCPIDHSFNSGGVKPQYVTVATGQSRPHRHRHRTTAAPPGGDAR